MKYQNHGQRLLYFLLFIILDRHLTFHTIKPLKTFSLQLIRFNKKRAYLCVVE